MLVLVLAVTCGASAALTVNYYGTGASQTNEKPDTTPVVVAAVDIPRVRTIMAEDVTIQQWPKKVLPEGILTSAKQAVGRVALSSMLPGEPLFEKKLASREAGQGVEALIPEGMRAYTIQAKAVATNVAGFILPGNCVDVLFHLRGQTNDDSGGGSTTTLLQAVEVLAVGQALEAPAENRVPDVQSVTLLVTPEQVAKLDLGQSMGTLALSLRNPVDKQDARPSPALLADLRYKQEPPFVLPEEIETETEAAPEPEPIPEPQSIRTLRGGHRGHIWVMPPPKPKTRDEKPKNRDEKPKIRDEEPKIRDEEPKIRDEIASSDSDTQ
jgi:pilus assembly protein CpaB